LPQNIEERPLARILLVDIGNCGRFRGSRWFTERRPGQGCPLRGPGL